MLQQFLVICPKKMFFVGRCRVRQLRSASRSTATYLLLPYNYSQLGYS